MVNEEIKKLRMRNKSLERESCIDNNKASDIKNYLNEIKRLKNVNTILEEDLNSIFEKVTFCKNYVCTNNNPKKALLEILFNEKDLIKGVSDRLVNSESKYIGISHENMKNFVEENVKIILDKLKNNNQFNSMILYITFGIVAV